MAEEFRLEIPGPPHGQGRPRIGRGPGGAPRAYTPAQTRSYASRIGDEWRAAGRPVLPAGPYGISVDAFHARPAGHYLSDGESLSASGRRAQFPGKPDIDNVLKLVIDALVACGAIPDDRFLVQVLAHKWWATPRERERVAVNVWTHVPAEVAA